MDLIASARRVIRMETEAVAGLEKLLTADFEQTVRMMLDTKGRVITTGMGKAGLIAKKVAATMASTGTPSYFVHPAESFHGDLGMITADDMVIAFSFSGQTEEVLRMLPYLTQFKIPTVAVTSKAESDLAKNATVGLILQIEREACPLNLAPTSSTTAMLALGDALALTALEARGFKPEDYAVFHPGGSLGRRLLTKVSDLMHAGADCPIVRVDQTIQDAIFEMTSKKLASTAVVDERGKLVGFFSDGDLRRYLMGGSYDFSLPIVDVMTKNPKSTRPDVMAARALEVLREYKIIELPVVDPENLVVGMIHLHDITRAGIT